MTCNNKFILWVLVALGLGSAGGYLYSSRFCNISINRRAEKKIALNQTLRELLAQHAFWIHNYIRATFFNSSDQQAVANRLIKNEEEIAHVLAAYYGKDTGAEFSSLLEQNTKLIGSLVNANNNPAQMNELKNRWNKNAEALATLLAKLNPEWAFSFDILKAGMQEQLALIMQEIEALQKNNWPRAIEIFDKHLNFALQIADELDKGIIKQFPNKF